MTSLFFKTFLAILLSVAMEGQRRDGGAIVYTHDQLITLCKPVLLPRARPEILAERWWRHWGCRAGAKLRAKKRRFCTAVPVLITGA